MATIANDFVICTGSHSVGIALTAASTLFLLLASVVYFQQARSPARLKGVAPPLVPLALLMSLLVIVGIAVATTALQSFRTRRTRQEMKATHE